MIGKRIAHYEVTASIGAGGMGEVYRATDTRLNRDVALKILPEQFAADNQRMARFEREAQVLASLSHPNIGAIYGIEDAGDTKALVLELIEGPTLADRIARGPIPVDDAVPIALQITEALEAAHEKGVIHRDLKPANIKLTPEGQVKVLDFGLAKAMDDTPEQSLPDMTHSPTLTMAATQAGLILGTAAYMSPEQAKGEVTDRRTDIWSFGAVLFEMLTGSRVFDGGSVAEVLAVVITREPDWTAVPPALPAPVKRVLKHCLVKDPRMRLHDIGDARIELLTEDVDDPSVVDATRPPSLPTTTWLAAAAAVALLAFAAGWWLPDGTGSGSSVPAEATLAIHIPPEAAFLQAVEWPQNNVAISPDGSQIVYRGEDLYEGYHTTGQLFSRPINSLEATPIPGTEAAFNPFFSPDGRWIAFFTRRGELVKVPAEGGRPTTITDGLVGAAWGFGSWGDDGNIVFAPWESALFEVSSDGGEAVQLTEPGTSETHAAPEVLPGSRFVLFSAIGAISDSIKILDRTGGTEAALIELGGYPSYLESGHLLFLRAGVPFVVPFDDDTQRIDGTPVALPFDPRVDTPAIGSPRAQMAVSDNGTLVYVPPRKGASRTSEFRWINREGRIEETFSQPVTWPVFHLFSDGRRALVSAMAGNVGRIHILDLARKTLDPWKAVPRAYLNGAITGPDQTIIYTEVTDTGSVLTISRLDEEEPLHTLALEGQSYVTPSSVTADGRFVIYLTYGTDTGGDLWALDTTSERGPDNPFPVVDSRAYEYSGAVSPDGQWIAYTLDDETIGRDLVATRVMVQAFPHPGLREVVSRSGQSAFNPEWSADGREIFYSSETARKNEDGWWEYNFQLIGVNFEASPEISLSEPRVVLEGPYQGGGDNGYSVRVSRDGQRFLVVRADQAHQDSDHLVVVLNWFEQLKRLAPSGP